MVLKKWNVLSPIMAAAMIVGTVGAPLRADEPKTKTAPAARLNDGGLRPGETRDQKRERLLTGLEQQIGKLSADQKKHILAIYAAAGDEMGAARENASLSEEQRDAIVSRVHGDLSNRISFVLTTEQKAKFKSGQGGGFGRARANETPEQRRERIIGRYSAVLTDLTEDQKNKLVAASDGARDAMEAARNNPALSEEQKQAEVTRIHDGGAERVKPILTAEQFAKWQAAAAERRANGFRRERNLKPGETEEQKQARLLQPYEAVILDLTPEQKAKLIEVAESAYDVKTEGAADETRTAKQKEQIAKRIQDSTRAKLVAILTKAQLAKWEEAQKVKTARLDKSEARN